MAAVMKYAWNSFHKSFCLCLQQSEIIFESQWKFLRQMFLKDVSASHPFSYSFFLFVRFDISNRGGHLGTFAVAIEAGRKKDNLYDLLLL